MSKSNQNPNFNAVMIEMIRRFTALCMSGKFWSGVSMLVFFFLTLKMDSKTVNDGAKLIFDAIYNDRFYFVLIASFFGMLIYGCWKHHQIDKLEIERLVSLRRELMHGIAEGKYNPLSNHHSSDNTA